MRYRVTLRVPNPDGTTGTEMYEVDHLTIDGDNQRIVLGSGFANDPVFYDNEWVTFEVVQINDPERN